MKILETEEFKFIEKKVIDSNYALTKQENDCLKMVYEEIQKTHGHNLILDISCPSCIANAVECVLNFINENKVKEVPVKNTVTRKVTEKK